MPDEQTLSNQQKVKKCMKTLASSLEEFSRNLRLNPGDKNCEHEWETEVRRCSWMSGNPLIAMQVCKKCHAEKINQGTHVTMPGGEGYTSAEMTLDKDGWPLGYLET